MVRMKSVSGKLLGHVKKQGGHKRPFVGVSQGTVLGFGDGFGAILWENVAKS